MLWWAAMLGRWVIVLALVGCTKDVVREPMPFEMSIVPLGIDPRATGPGPGYDPLALAIAAGDKQGNPDPGVPPACYTRTDDGANTCASCHTRSSYPNLTNDWELQQNFPFFDLATNHWRNQNRDRRALVARFSDADIAAYIRTDNYEPLRAAMATRELPGWKPDLDFTRGFDALGFAADGSGWRALRYKPFAGTFWPIHGSTDDAFIRLPRAFRVDAAGKPSLAIYRTNLAILEAAITGDPKRAPRDLSREIEPVDEAASQLDLDGDGALGTATKVVGLPAHFAGGAHEIRVTRALYPQGVELMHTVRYLDPDAPAFIARRMKEVRYATKAVFLENDALAKAHRAVENPDAGPEGDPQRGYRNAVGWQLQGYIEDGRGWLRLQTHEEHQFCMGCHSNLGITVDQTFSFPRKVPGAAGWRPQDPRGIPDAPAVGEQEPEYARYLARARKAAASSHDIGAVLYPTRTHAFELDRAYLANVLEQSYVWGRDSVAAPIKDVHFKIDERSTGLGEADRVVRDVSLLLDWNATADADRSRAARR